MKVTLSRSKERPLAVQQMGGCSHAHPQHVVTTISKALHSSGSPGSFVQASPYHLHCGASASPFDASVESDTGMLTPVPVMAPGMLRSWASFEELTESLCDGGMSLVDLTPTNESASQLSSCSGLSKAQLRPATTSPVGIQTFSTGMENNTSSPISQDELSMVSAFTHEFVESPLNQWDQFIYQPLSDISTVDDGYMPLIPLDQQILPATATSTFKPPLCSLKDTSALSSSALMASIPPAQHLNHLFPDPLQYVQPQCKSAAMLPSSSYSSLPNVTTDSQPPQLFSGTLGPARSPVANQVGQRGTEGQDDHVLPDHIVELLDMIISGEGSTMKDSIQTPPSHSSSSSPMNPVLWQRPLKRKLEFGEVEPPNKRPALYTSEPALSWSIQKAPFTPVQKNSQLSPNQTQPQGKALPFISTLLPKAPTTYQSPPQPDVATGLVMP